MLINSLLLFVTMSRAGRQRVSGLLHAGLICERWGESVQNWTCLLPVTVGHFPDT